MNEIWKSLKGIVEYGDYYEVSNLGRVRSIERYVKCRNGVRIARPKIKNAINHDTGYLKINLYKDNKTKSYFVHRLVALAFLENPLNLPQVNHKDENKKNNNVDNLEFCDAKYNTNFGTGHERSAKKHCKKIKVFKYPSMEYVDTFESSKKASKYTGAKKQNITKVCKGEINHAKGYYFEYVEGDENA